MRMIALSKSCNFESLLVYAYLFTAYAFEDNLIYHKSRLYNEQVTA